MVVPVRKPPVQDLLPDLPLQRGALVHAVRCIGGATARRRSCVYVDNADVSEPGQIMQHQIELLGTDGRQPFAHGSAEGLIAGRGFRARAGHHVQNQQS